MPADCCGCSTSACGDTQRCATCLQTVAKGLKRLRKEKAAFNTMTELADKLLNTGEYGIYSIPKEDLEDAVDAVRGSLTDARTGSSSTA